jgi:hypothetical protein
MMMIMMMWCLWKRIWQRNPKKGSSTKSSPCLGSMKYSHSCILTLVSSQLNSSSARGRGKLDKRYLVHGAKMGYVEEEAAIATPEDFQKSRLGRSITAQAEQKPPSSNRALSNPISAYFKVVAVKRVTLLLQLKGSHPSLWVFVLERIERVCRPPREAAVRRRRLQPNSPQAWHPIDIHSFSCVAS